MDKISLHHSVAILIDADNVQLSYLEQVLGISDYYGKLYICRAYGDWNQPQLLSWCEKIDALKIERIQVDRVRKNSTDHRLLIDVGEILGGEFYNTPVQVFIIVSGDGHFSSACKLLQERGKQVIGIGNRKQSSKVLRENCHKFYCLEDLDTELANLKERFPIAPSEVREFFDYLFLAYYQLVDKKYDWVSYAQLGTKLYELTPDYESKFGKYKLSQWIKNFDGSFESTEQMIRRIDTTGLSLMLAAYHQTRQSDGWAYQGLLGKKLRELDPDYESRFGSKKLSKWLESYPHIFKIHENCVGLMSESIEY